MPSRKKNQKPERKKLPKIKRGDLVVVIAGKDQYQKSEPGEAKKRRIGRVLRVDPDTQRVVVERVNMIKRHTRPNPPRQPGGVLEKEASIHISNVMLWSEKAKKGSRVKVERDAQGRRVRILKECGTVLS